MKIEVKFYDDEAGARKAAMAFVQDGVRIGEIEVDESVVVAVGVALRGVVEAIERETGRSVAFAGVGEPAHLPFLKMELNRGCSLIAAIVSAGQLTCETHQCVGFEFNGVLVVVDEYDDLAQVEMKVMRALGERE